MLGLFALLDFPFDHTLADGHAQRVHRRVLGQRKRIHRFRACRLRIAKALRDFAAQDHAAHAELDVRLHRRRGDIHARLIGFQKQRAALHLIDRDLRTSGNRNQNENDDCQFSDHCLSLR